LSKKVIFNLTFYCSVISLAKDIIVILNLE
jgi:hypothetical protein